MAISETSAENKQTERQTN